jgi:hypothetical protein
MRYYPTAWLSDRDEPGMAVVIYGSCARLASRGLSFAI